jgi:DNA-binding CsgD family transcriptional regulator
VPEVFVRRGVTDLRAKERRRQEVALASEGACGRIAGGEQDGQARRRQDVPKKRRGGEDPVTEAKRPGQEEPPETSGALTLGLDLDGEAWDLTLEVRQLVGRDRRRRSCEFLIPLWNDVSVCGTIVPEGECERWNGFARPRGTPSPDGDPPFTFCEVVWVEHRGDEGPESTNDRERDPGRPASDPGDPRTEHGVAYPTAEVRIAEGRRGQDSERDLAYWVNWQSALYAFVLGVLCVFLVPLTSFWWIVPVLGVAAPVALVLVGGRERGPTRLEAKKTKEGELLRVLAEQAELTPAATAMRTSLTVDEASKMLEDLARKGHLRLHAGDGVVSYALAEQSRASLPDETGALTRPAAEEDGAPGGAAARLEEPLSEREMEVLALLASGRTNAEIARDLFVALGTVKSHVNNIYRKLGAANRAEAVTRAREMRLLR